MAASERNRALRKVPLKRLRRGNNTHVTSIKKRVMAALSLSCTNVPQTSLSSSGACGYQVSKTTNRMEATPDLSPGLKHTLALFSLSSQSSLGGPAAFSAQSVQYKMAPPLAQGGVATGPLLVPPDSSTDLGLCCVEGESISCFSVGGELRLCLPQLLNTVLRDFSLQQINSVCDQLYLFCSRCDAAQLHALKVLDVLPSGTSSCGLITLTDAQRLCNALLHPGEGLSQEPHRVHSSGEERESEESGGFWVEHQCLGKCEGLFIPQLYSRPDMPCICCALCQTLLCPERFVMHSHRQPDKRTCHWGFDSAKWTCYLQLAHRHLRGADEKKLQRSLKDMKSKFQQEKRQKHLGVSSPAFVFDLKFSPAARLSCVQYETDSPAGYSVSGEEIWSPAEEREKDSQKHRDSQNRDTDSQTPQRLRPPDCSCKHLVTETHQETIYSKQLSELHQRLERAEEEREELQEELRREREARERLQRTISELKQQMKSV